MLLVQSALIDVSEKAIFIMPVYEIRKPPPLIDRVFVNVKLLPNNSLIVTHFMECSMNGWFALMASGTFNLLLIQGFGQDIKKFSRFGGTYYSCG